MAAICTLGELRELTEGLVDDVNIYVLSPAGENEWRVIGGDVSVHLSPGPSEVWINLDEGVGADA